MKFVECCGQEAPSISRVQDAPGYDQIEQLGYLAPSHDCLL